MTAMTMTIWATWAYVLLPPAVILLVLLTIPFPRPVAKGVVRMNEFILNLHVAGIPVFSVITGLSFVALAGQTYDLQKRYSYQITGIEKHYEADLQHRATRWRAERNWWISALTFTIYWMLMAFHSMKKQLLLASRRTD